MKVFKKTKILIEECEYYKLICYNDNLYIHIPSPKLEVEQCRLYNGDNSRFIYIPFGTIVEVLMTGISV